MISSIATLIFSSTKVDCCGALRARHSAWVASLVMMFSSTAPITALAQTTSSETTTSTLLRVHLDSLDVAYLRKIRSEGRNAISAFVAARLPTTPSMNSLVSALTSRGGTVELRADEIGYLRVTLPLDVVGTLRSIPEIADYRIIGVPSWPGPVEASDPRFGSSDGLREYLPWDSWNSTDVVAPFPTALVTRPNPYIPLDEIHADIFIERLPNADGRGVTIGIVEAPVDFTHPALQTARTLRGDIVPKIAGLIDVHWSASPPENAGQSRRHIAALSTDTTLIAPDGSVVFDGVRLRMPTPGSWHLGSWVRTNPYDETAPQAPVHVAWQDTTEVWVDVNRNADFRDDRAIANINVRFGAGILPADSPSGFPMRNSFAVAFDPKGRPHLYSDYGSNHTTMIAGTAAGSRFFGGSAGGIAPGARILPVITGRGESGMLEAFLLAARDRRIDIIMATATVFDGFPYAGTVLPGLLLERIATRYNKPIFISAGNQGPALGAVDLGSAVPSVVSVGAYASRRSLRVNNGWRVIEVDNVMEYSARGPTSDGALKPDLVAPTAMVTAASCSSWKARHHPVGYELPDCYMVGSGTSNASPFAAGAAALLVSAARQQGLLGETEIDGRAIRWALMAGARPLDSIDSYEQGAGLIRIDSAWALLQTALPATLPGGTRNRGARHRLYDVSIIGPVENGYARYLPDRTGAGMFLREQWHAGRRGTRHVGIIRTSGPSSPVPYRLRWRGNDGTFALRESTIILPLGEPVKLDVVVAPASAGIHAAVLELSDPATGVTMHRAPVTVIAAVPLVANKTVVWEGSVTGIRNQRFFAEVPAGMKALQIKWSPSIVLSARIPLAGTNGGIGLIAKADSAGNKISTVVDPAPGTWEFTGMLQELGEKSKDRYRITITASPVAFQKGTF